MQPWLTSLSVTVTIQKPSESTFRGTSQYNLPPSTEKNWLHGPLTASIRDTASYPVGTPSWLTGFSSPGVSPCNRLHHNTHSISHITADNFLIGRGNNEGATLSLLTLNLWKLLTSFSFISSGILFIDTHQWHFSFYTKPFSCSLYN